LRRRLVDRLLLCLHDVGKRRVARLVQPEIGGDHGGLLEGHSFESAIDFAHHFDVAAVQLDLRGKGALRPAKQTGKHLAGFIDIFTLARSTPEPSDLTRTFTLKSTTRFTGTRIFMRL